MTPASPARLQCNTDSGGSNNYAFGTQNGFFVVTTGNGTILSLPKASAKKFRFTHCRDVHRDYRQSGQHAIGSLPRSTSVERSTAGCVRFVPGKRRELFQLSDRPVNSVVGSWHVFLRSRIEQEVSVAVTTGAFDRIEVIEGPISSAFRSVDYGVIWNIVPSP